MSNRRHGEDHPHAKLTQEQADAIRAATGISQRKLAEKYGVSPATISLIRSGKLWAESEGNAPDPGPSKSALQQALLEVDQHAAHAAHARREPPLHDGHGGNRDSDGDLALEAALSRAHTEHRQHLFPSADDHSDTDDHEPEHA